MSWPEVKECVENEYSVVLPVGSLEQHGKHLPLNVDYLLCERVVREAARQSGQILVLPTLVYGRSSHHFPYCGTVSLQLETFVNIINDILFSLYKHGFTRIIIVNGHGGNRGALAAAIGKFMEKDIKHPLIFLANYYSFGVEEVNKIRESEKGGMAHAGEYETSLSLYLQPRLVEMEKAVKRIPLSPLPEYVYADLMGDSPLSMSVSYGEKEKSIWEYTFCESGVAGDPTVATEDKGRKIFEIVVKYMLAFFEKMKEL